ncbi:MAG: F0F1 ATP synthase subunit B [Bacteroidia bacterium]|nr:F0F1 ATP synthase subunit B [Bacteroidia bacterium]
MLFVLSADFSVIKPDVGLLFWTTIFFLLFWFLIGKYAFKPIANALKKREDDIQDALDEAKRAKEEMANLKAENEKILAEARQERASIIKEANNLKSSIIKEAKEKAKEEAGRVTNSAILEIENEKKAAIIELKNQVGSMATEIAEKVIRKELSNSAEHESFVNKLVEEIKLN